jgi:hypothetical protein
MNIKKIFTLGLICTTGAVGLYNGNAYGSARLSRDVTPSSHSSRPQTPIQNNRRGKIGALLQQGKIFIPVLSGIAILVAAFWLYYSGRDIPPALTTAITVGIPVAVVLLVIYDKMIVL